MNRITNYTVCRYFLTDLFKLFLLDRSLHFTSLSSFFDKTEGVVNSDAVLLEIEAMQGKNFATKNPYAEFDLEKMKEQSKKQKRERKRIYASCWGQLETESAALWNIFAKNGKGVLVHANWNNLYHSIVTPDQNIPFQARPVEYKGFRTFYADDSGEKVIGFEKLDYYKYEEEFRFILDLRNFGDESISRVTETRFLVNLKNFDFIEKITIGYEISREEGNQIRDLCIENGIPKERIFKSFINFVHYEEE